MKKKLMCMLLVFCMMLTLLPIVALAAPGDQEEAPTEPQGESAQLFSAMPLPVVTATISAETPVILINNMLNTQTSHSSISAAMTAIGTNAGAYTLVFAENYAMQAADMGAIKANGQNAESLGITSKYAVASAPNAPISKQVSATGSTGYDWPFQTNTTVYGFTLSVNGCVRMLGCGHSLTLAEDVKVTGKLQIFGGSNVALGTTGKPATTNVVVKSGNIESVYGGNNDGVFTGVTNVEISGAASVTNAYPGSQSAVGDNSVCNLTVDGADGAVFQNMATGWNGNNVPATGIVAVTLKNVKSGSVNVATIDLLSNSKGTSTLNIEGDCQVCTHVKATNLNIKKDATLTCGGNKDGANGTAAHFTGILDIQKALTLEEGASYIHAGSGEQKVGGDIAVTGSDAMLAIYKQNFASATVALSIGGSFTGSNKLNLELFNDKEIGARDGDVLLTFAAPANANEANYNSYVCALTNMLYVCRKDGSNIKLAGITTAYLPYYEPLDEQAAGEDGLYKYVEIGRLTESDGGSHVVYRKIDGGKLYPADAAGNITGPEITYDEQLSEKPQPSLDYPVNYEDYGKTMVRFDEIGKYHITAAVGTNSTGIGENDIDDGTASGVPGEQIVNIDNKGDDNASWAILNQTNSNCTIHKAYLVMTTTLIGGGPAEKRSKTLNDTMRLIAPNGDEMLSNGYLPEGTVNAADSSPMTTDTPVLLYDTARNTLGEAMVITDVTDFVKEHGYGKYYGADLPYDEATDIDAAIAWRLIVVEEDSKLNFLRKVAIQVGPITNSGEASVELLLGGFTTPGTTLSNFGGQILLIGSDNTTEKIVGGGTGSNLHNTFYPDSTKEAFTIVASNDGRTEDIIERPIGYWSQGFMDIDGRRLDADQVSHVSETGGMGIDMSLLNISNIPNQKWDTDGGHNLYLTEYSPSIKLTTKSDKTGIGYIDTLAISTDLETPEFVTKIIHTDLTPTEGVDIIAGKTVIVKATAENITRDESSIIGSLNTQAIVTVDERLSNVRDITATFEKTDGTKISVVGDYDADTHTIAFDFGVEKGEYHLYNEAGDTISISFIADTDAKEATIDNEDVCYTNSIVVTGEDIYRRTGEAPYKDTDVVPAYAQDSDSFDTYLVGNLIISKTVSGNDASAAKEFTFTVKLTDTTVNGKLGDMNFENGEVTFTLKAGESKTATDLPAGIGYNVEESDNDGYIVTVNGETATKAVGTITAGTTSTAAFNNHKAAAPLTVTKLWAGDSNPKQPTEVMVQLYCSGQAYGAPVALNADNNWTYTWRDLSDSYNWTVDEVETPAGYTKTVSHVGTRWTITNTYDFMLNTTDHYAYIIGYPDGSVRPKADITRAEVATIFFRMMTDEKRVEYWSTTNSFSDVSKSDWFNNAVSTMEKTGVINGYADGTFRPNESITRAELVKIAVSFFKFTGNSTIEAQFTDIEGHWAQNYINFAVELGLIDGYPDGTFAPDKNVTRCEAMKVINHVLGRAPEKNHLLSNMIEWPDNGNTSAWYYAEVQEATNSHEYGWINYNESTVERWTELLPVRDWAAFETAWANGGNVPNPGEVVQ